MFLAQKQLEWLSRNASSTSVWFYWGCHRGFFFHGVLLAYEGRLHEGSVLGVCEKHSGLVLSGQPPWGVTRGSFLHGMLLACEGIGAGSVVFSMRKVFLAPGKKVFSA